MIILPLSAGHSVRTARTLLRSLERRNEKGLKRATIAFSYRHYVAAYPTGRVHRAVFPNENRQVAIRQRMAARDQARRVSGDRPEERRTGEALQPSRQ